MAAYNTISRNDFDKQFPQADFFNGLELARRLLGKNQLSFAKYFGLSQGTYSAALQTKKPRSFYRDGLEALIKDFEFDEEIAETLIGKRDLALDNENLSPKTNRGDIYDFARALLAERGLKPHSNKLMSFFSSKLYPSADIIDKIILISKPTPEGKERLLNLAEDYRAKHHQKYGEKVRKLKPPESSFDDLVANTLKSYAENRGLNWREKSGGRPAETVIDGAADSRIWDWSNGDGHIIRVELMEESKQIGSGNSHVARLGKVEGAAQPAHIAKA